MLQIATALWVVVSEEDARRAGVHMQAFLWHPLLAEAAAGRGQRPCALFWQTCVFNCFLLHGAKSGGQSGSLLARTLCQTLRRWKVGSGSWCHGLGSLSSKTHQPHIARCDAAKVKAKHLEGCRELPEDALLKDPRKPLEPAIRLVSAATVQGVG